MVTLLTDNFFDFQGARPLGFGGYANAKRFGRRSVLALGVPNSGARRVLRSYLACIRRFL